MTEETPLEKSRRLLALRAKRDSDIEIKDALREEWEKQQKNMDAESERLQRLRQGRKFLNMIPQGKGSGLDADTVDGKHAHELRGGGGGGGIGYGSSALEKTASYIVRVNGSNYEAINGSTGKISYSGIDASAVINAAITALSSGGKIFIKAGTYNITAPIIPSSNLLLVGEGYATILSQTADINEVILIQTVYRCQVANLRINGNKASRTTGTGIHIKHVGAFVTEQNHVVENVIIEDMDDYGVLADVTVTADCIRNIHFNKVVTKNCDLSGFHYTITDSFFTDCVSLENGNAGFYSRGGCNSHKGCAAYGNSWAGFDFSEGQRETYTNCEGSNNQQSGFQSGGATNSHRFVGCWGHENGQDAGVWAGLYLTSPTDVIITGCSFFTSPQEYGIYLSDPTRCLVEDNNVYGNAVAGIYLTGSVTNCIIRDNVGFVTENSGYSTGTGAQQTIAHGCNFTPTESEVFLSERTTGGALAKQTAAPDATNIYITATTDKDYNWKVEKA